MNHKEKVSIIAHRGASNIAPENTLKAFKKAIELKADYIEFDIHQSKDGEIIIIHDAYILHKNGQKKFIKDMVMKEIKEFIEPFERNVHFKGFSQNPIFMLRNKEELEHFLDKIIELENNIPEKIDYKDISKHLKKINIYDDSM